MTFLSPRYMVHVLSSWIWADSCLHQIVEEGRSDATWLLRLRWEKKKNTTLSDCFLSLSLLEPSHHIMRNLKPNWEATCEFSCRQPHQASSQHLHQPPEMWKITIHIISVPNLESSSWEPRHHGAETSHPRCMLSEFLNHRNHERPKKFYCF